MIPYFMNNFLERLEHVLGERKKHPWGQGLGITRGTVDNMFKGVVPASDTLNAISRIENVSISWLLDGKGNPFYVFLCLDDEAAQSYAEDTLVDDGWSGYLISDGERLALAFTLPAEYEVKGVATPYTILELLVGNISMAMAEKLQAFPAVRWQYRCTVSSAVMDDILNGQVGTWQLLLSPKFILSNAQKINDRGAATIEETLPRMKYTDRSSDLATKIKQLNPDQQRALEAIIDAMLPSAAVGKTPVAVEMAGTPTATYKL